MSVELCSLSSKENISNHIHYPRRKSLWNIFFVFEGCEMDNVLCPWRRTDRTTALTSRKVTLHHILCLRRRTVRTIFLDFEAGNSGSVVFEFEGGHNRSHSLSSKDDTTDHIVFQLEGGHIGSYSF